MVLKLSWMRPQSLIFCFFTAYSATASDAGIPYPRASLRQSAPFLILLPAHVPRKAKEDDANAWAAVIHVGYPN